MTVMNSSKSKQLILLPTHIILFCVFMGKVQYLMCS